MNPISSYTRASEVWDVHKASMEDWTEHKTGQGQTVSTV